MPTVVASRSHATRRAHKNLVARSRPARTFAGFVAFAALLFLTSGIYLIADPLLHPVAVHDMSVIAGAFASALGFILLFYLVKPAGSRRRMEVAQPKKTRQLSRGATLGESLESSAPPGCVGDAVHARQ